MGINVCIVGTGPSALMAGSVLAEKGLKVSFFDKSKSLSRKFLVAGKGGFNITNAEHLNSFISHYNQPLVQQAIHLFSNEDFRKFLLKIDVSTFEGTSGRVFPEKGINPSKLVKLWWKTLEKNNAQFYLNHQLIELKKNKLVFVHDNQTKEYQSDLIILALGGASWSVTGSDGKWVQLLERHGVVCNPFQSSNSGFEVEEFARMNEFSGLPIKNCKLFSVARHKYGDIVVTDYGIEGTPVYSLNRDFREGKEIFIDFKPDLTVEAIEQRMLTASTISEGLRKLKLSKPVSKLLRLNLDKRTYTNPQLLSQKIKNWRIDVKRLRPLDEAISTVGGVDVHELDDNFQLKKMPDIYCVGEMVDWDAPTGGYLIQGSVSSGYKAAVGILSNLDQF